MTKIAKTLTDVTNQPAMQVILDRRSSPGDIMAVSQEMLDAWKYDLYTRKPGPAYKDGTFVGTDLDLAALLYALVDRGAVVILPKYKSRTPATHTEGVHVVDPENRYGKIMGLVSNQSTFNFSVRILDAKVITTDSVGKPRTYNITDENGDWYEGWEKLNFLPTAAENDFMTTNELFAEQAHIAFKNFVAPGRWTSFFGQYYLMAKTMEARLVEENAYWRAAIRDMLNEGIRYPSRGGRPIDKPLTVTEKGQSKVVKSFQVEVDVPWMGQYPRIVENEETLVSLTQGLRDRERTLEQVRFLVRVTEFAYYKKLQSGESFPTWVQDAAWEDFKKPRSKTVWQRLTLSDEVALRRRVWDKKIVVK
jgi:hypothetical protein